MDKHRLSGKNISIPKTSSQNHRKLTQTGIVIAIFIAMILFSMIATGLKAQTPQTDLAQISKEMAEIDSSLRPIVDAYNKTEEEITALNEDISRLEGEVTAKTEEIKQLSHEIEGMLYNYYTWSQDGFANIIANATDVNEYYRNNDYMERFLADNYSLFIKAETLKEELDEDKEKVEGDKREKEQALQQLAEQRTQVEANLADVRERMKEALAKLGVQNLGGVNWDMVMERGTPQGTQIIAVAAAQFGKPYVWAGTGPDVFDCSGLTQYCTLHGAGRLTPREAHAQWVAGTKIPVDQIKPGDLVCFAKDGIRVHHIGIVVGDGNFIHAPQSGDVVRSQALSSRSDIIGFVRYATD